MEFNINAIKEIAESKGFSIQRLATEIEVTESGLHAMFKKGDMKVSTLQKISETLKEPIENFFSGEEKAKNKVSEPGAVYSSALEECRQELNEWKNKAFDVMEKYNRLLEERIQDRNRQTG